MPSIAQSPPSSTKNQRYRLEKTPNGERRYIPASSRRTPPAEYFSQANCMTLGILPEDWKRFLIRNGIEFFKSGRQHLAPAAAVRAVISSGVKTLPKRAPKPGPDADIHELLSQVAVRKGAAS